MRTVAAELAFEKDEAVDFERAGPQVGVAPKEGVHGFGIAAVPPSQRYVR